MRLYETQKVVEKVLRDVPKTRGSDRPLYLEVLKSVGIDIAHTSIQDLLSNPDAPNTESVRRTRQKLQAMHPELKANSDVEAMRMLNEERVKRYAINREN